MLMHKLSVIHEARPQRRVVYKWSNVMTYINIKAPKVPENEQKRQPDAY